MQTANPKLPISRQQVGKLTIHNDMYTGQPHVIALLFAQCLPVKLEFEYFNQCWNIVALSDRFDKVQEGQVMPEYSAVFKTEEDGSVSFVEFTKTHSL